MAETAKKLFDEGKLNQAIEALGSELRDNPSDAQRRTFLFELLCFAGLWERADKQLEILAGADLSGAPTHSKDRRIGALLYRAAISAERTRHEMFRDKSGNDAPETDGETRTVSGVVNGRPFQSIADADPRIGSRLEILAGETYLWVPLEHIASIEIEPPKRLRDLLWAPATVRTGPGFNGADLGNVLLPVLAPFSSTHADDAVRLGRMTVWESAPDGSEVPFGQKMLLADDEEIPLLEVRTLEIHPLAVN